MKRLRLCSSFDVAFLGRSIEGGNSGSWCRSGEGRLETQGGDQDDWDDAGFQLKEMIPGPPGLVPRYDLKLVLDPATLLLLGSELFFENFEVSFLVFLETAFFRLLIMEGFLSILTGGLGVAAPGIDA